MEPHWRAPQQAEVGPQAVAHLTSNDHAALHCNRWLPIRWSRVWSKNGDDRILALRHRRFPHSQAQNTGNVTVNLLIQLHVRVDKWVFGKPSLRWTVTGVAKQKVPFVEQ